MGIRHSQNFDLIAYFSMFRAQNKEDINTLTLSLTYQKYPKAVRFIKHSDLA